MRLRLTMRNVLVSLVCSALGLIVCFNLVYHEGQNGELSPNMTMLLYAIITGLAAILFVLGVFAMSWLPPYKKEADEEDEDHKEYA
jgi:hypothetical protein